MKLPGIRLRRRKPQKARDAMGRLVQVLEANCIDSVLDVGANVGQYAGALRAANFAGQIVSAEPGKEAHAALCRAAAGDAGWRVLPRMALSDATGTAELHRHNRSDMNALTPALDATFAAFPKLQPVGSESVPVRRLDGLWPEALADVVPERTLLKLDTQGHEARVLAGAGDLLGRIAAIQAELSLLAMYEGEALFVDIAGDLRRAGYEIHLLLPGAFSRHHMRQLQADAVFVRATGR